MEIPVKYGHLTLMTLYDAGGAAQAARVVMDKPPADHVDPLDEAYQVEEVWTFNDLSVQTRHGSSALQQLQALCSKGSMILLKSASDAQQLFAKRLAQLPKTMCSELP